MSVNESFRYLNIGLPEDILRRKLHGDLDGAVRLIDRRLKQDIPAALRQCLTAQREMIVRLPGDFPYTRREALALVRAWIPGFTEAEFDAQVDAGQIRWIYVDGEMRVFDRFFVSMCKSQPDIARRAGAFLSSWESAGAGFREEGRLDRCVQHMKARGQARTRTRIRASLRLMDEHFIPGMFLRAHLPLPIESEEQEDVVIESMFPAHGRVAPGDAAQRTICWEGPAAENHTFSVEYSYTRTAVYRDTEPLAADGSQPCFQTGEEEPHIVFTPYIRALTNALTQGVQDPLEKARRFYDYITLNMDYTYMPAYFSLEHIPGECARSMTGDCGVFALLFLTLCRCAGIPAQWESGLAAEPTFCGAHDWARFYVEPHGWLYADPSYGIAAVRAGSEERRRFYFGNLDPYRMAANRAFQAGFTVEKEHWRADPYDNQLGELETADRGLGYGEYMRCKEVLSCQDL